MSRALQIDEAGRAVASDTVAVLLMPAVQGARRFQIGFQHGDAANLSIEGARTLYRQLGQLLNIHDGKPPR